MVIDPQNIIRKYNDEELQELLIFCVCVAGKSAATIAPRVDKLFKFLQLRIGSNCPLNYACALPLDLWSDLYYYGIGCYKLKAAAIIDISVRITYDDFDLSTCTASELEEVYGIGPKTARAFIMWSRPNQQHAILDTHILKWLREQGIKAPKSTPSGKKYLTLEQEYLKLVPAGMSPAEFDLMIWKSYSNH